MRLLAKEPIARKHVRAVSDQEVAIKAELPMSRVKEISELISWDSIPIGEAERFCIGCGFDPFNCYDRNRAMAYYRSKAKFTYLRVSPYWTSTFRPLIRVLASAKNS